jgi:hypothetical protein
LDAHPNVLYCVRKRELGRNASRYEESRRDTEKVIAGATNTKASQIMPRPRSPPRRNVKKQKQKREMMTSSPRKKKKD